MKLPGIEIEEKKKEIIARKWRIREVSLFGSVSGGHFYENSDIDVLVQFDKKAEFSLFDLVEKASLRNPYRRKEILNTAKVIYASK